MQTSKSYKVLVVEDEGLIAHDIASRLEALGHEVVATVGTAEEAVEAAGAADIVLMDIRLDGPADGIEAAARIRERYHLPVVFLTAHADRSTLDRAKLAEPFGYIVKPLAHASLNTSIEMAVYKHKLERQLEEREAWLRAVLGSVADAVLVTDADGRVLMMNHAAESITGWIQPEAAGQTVTKVARFIESGSGEPLEDPIPLAYLRDAPVTLARDCQIVSRNGHQRTVEGTVAPVKAGNEIIGAVLTIRDVSSRRWEEQQLRQALKMQAIGRLAAGVSGEFGNLFSVIRTQCEVLSRQFAEFSPARPALEEIRQAATAADQMTRRLASFSTRQPGHPEVLSLNAIVRRMAKLVESVAGGRIEVTLRPDRLAGKIKADAAQIEQLIMNLVMHASGTMPDGGRLLIDTANLDLPLNGRVSHYVLLALTHTGVEPEIERLFEPASAGDENLALSIAHNIAAEHGGFLSARRTGDRGCRFEVLLPRFSEPALLPHAQSAAADSISMPTLLLIDDRENLRVQLHNFFEACGYNLLEAGDLTEAVALAQVHDASLDLVIAGEQTLEELMRHLPAAPAAGTKLLKVVDHAENAADEIRRPFTQAALLERVQAILPPRPVSSAAWGT